MDIVFIFENVSSTQKWFWKVFLNQNLERRITAKFFAELALYKIIYFPAGKMFFFFFLTV